MEIEFVRNDDHLIKQVVSLGTSNSRTLGHFPEGAYYEHAGRGFLICAYKEDSLLGYLLFSITKSKSCIRVIQLCVSKEARGGGVSKRLLDYLKSNFRQTLKGIALSCRTDYIEASALWESYGFKSMDKVRSRSKDIKWLYKWWYDFGNQDLFTMSQEDSNRIKAVLDANIIIKLRSNNEDDQSGARFLVEDWLVDVADYFFSPETYNEIKRDKSDERARKTRSYLTNFQEVKFDPDRRDEVLLEVKKILTGTTPNDVSDRKQISECIAGGIKYFITEDKGILDVGNEINEAYGVQVLRPTDFILLADESNNYTDYVSTRIAGVNYDYGNLKAGEVDEVVETMLAKDREEKKHQLRGIFTSCSSNVKNCTTRIIRNRSRDILGVLLCQLSEQEVLVPLIRTVKNNLSKTLFTQLVFEVINYAVSAGKNLIEISDRYVDTENQYTLESMGFVYRGGVWLKVTAQSIIRSSDLFEQSGVDRIFEKATLLKRLTEPDNNEFKIQIERKLWPLKFSDIDITTYIIPIKPHWASQLFDHYAAENSIFGAEPFLAWSRENVYYRSVNPVSEKAPARILWYSSSTKDKGAVRVNSIVACSYLDEVYIGSAKELFQKFRHFGIYEWKNIIELANDDHSKMIKALKFRDTEVFSTPVAFKQVNQILASHHRKNNTFASPLEISNSIFLEIYKLGGRS